MTDGYDASALAWHCDQATLKKEVEAGVIRHFQLGELRRRSGLEFGSFAPPRVHG
jgi:hypothetical protein